jgi:SecD/SecF fusion protein
VAKIVFIGLIVLLLVILGLLYSSYQKGSMTPEEAFAKKGGLRLVLEVDDAGIKAGQRGVVLEQMVGIIRNRVNQLGVSKALVRREGDKSIVVQIPGIENAERAKKIVARQALLEFRLVSKASELTRVLENLDIMLRIPDSQETKKSIDAENTHSEEKTMDSNPSLSADSSGVGASVSAKTRGDSILDEILAPLPDPKEVDSAPDVASEEKPFTSYVLWPYGGGVAVSEKNVENVISLLSTPEAKQVIPSRLEFLWSKKIMPFTGGVKGRTLYLVEKKAALTGRAIVNAEMRPDPDLPSRLDVLLTLDREGGMILQKITALNIGRALAIVLDGAIRSAPIIQTKIPGGQARITGIDSEEEASDLAILLRSGSLPSEIHIKEEQIVTPAR